MHLTLHLDYQLFNFQKGVVYTLNPRLCVKFADDTAVVGFPVQQFLVQEAGWIKWPAGRR